MSEQKEKKPTKKSQKKEATPKVEKTKQGKPIFPCAAYMDGSFFCLKKGKLVDLKKGDVFYGDTIHFEKYGVK